MLCIDQQVLQILLRQYLPVFLHVTLSLDNHRSSPFWCRDVPVAAQQLPPFTTTRGAVSRVRSRLAQCNKPHMHLTYFGYNPLQSIFHQASVGQECKRAN